MKVFKPLIAFLVILTLTSIVVGYLFPSQILTWAYSPTLYLSVCIGQAVHFLEENFTKAWEVEAQLRKNPDGTPKEPRSGRDFLVAFSHVLVLLSFLLYFPVAAQAPWAILYGLGISLNGILNGLVHTAILIRFRKNTGFVSGLFLLASGILLWVSIFVPLGV
ncbi:MAG: HXXEE domain-containing protein [Candidatus Thorarchaeota archaeon]